MTQEPTKAVDNIITIKEVYERVVALETKFDYQVEKGSKQGRFFWFVIFVVFAVEAVNFVFNFLTLNEINEITKLLR